MLATPAVAEIQGQRIASQESAPTEMTNRLKPPPTPPLTDESSSVTNTQRQKRKTAKKAQKEEEKEGDSPDKKSKKSKKDSKKKKKKRKKKHQQQSNENDEGGEPPRMHDPGLQQLHQRNLTQQLSNSEQIVNERSDTEEPVGSHRKGPQHAMEEEPVGNTPADRNSNSTRSTQTPTDRVNMGGWQQGMSPDFASTQRKPPLIMADSAEKYGSSKTAFDFTSSYRSMRPPGSEPASAPHQSNSPPKYASPVRIKKQKTGKKSPKSSKGPPAIAFAAENYDSANKSQNFMGGFDDSSMHELTSKEMGTALQEGLIPNGDMWNPNSWGQQASALPVPTQSPQRHRGEQNSGQNSGDVASQAVPAPEIPPQRESIHHQHAGEPNQQQGAVSVPGTVPQGKSRYQNMRPPEQQQIGAVAVSRMAPQGKLRYQGGPGISPRGSPAAPPQAGTVSIRGPAPLGRLRHQGSSNVSLSGGVSPTPLSQVGSVPMNTTTPQGRSHSRMLNRSPPNGGASIGVGAVAVSSAAPKGKARTTMRAFPRAGSAASDDGSAVGVGAVSVNSAAPQGKARTRAAVAARSNSSFVSSDDEGMLEVGAVAVNKPATQGKTHSRMGSSPKFSSSSGDGMSATGVGAVPVNNPAPQGKTHSRVNHRGNTSLSPGDSSFSRPGVTSVAGGAPKGKYRRASVESSSSRGLGATPVSSPAPKGKLQNPGLSMANALGESYSQGPGAYTMPQQAKGKYRTSSVASSIVSRDKSRRDMGIRQPSSASQHSGAVSLTLSQLAVQKPLTSHRRYSGATPSVISSDAQSTDGSRVGAVSVMSAPIDKNKESRPQYAGTSEVYDTERPGAVPSRGTGKIKQKERALEIRPTMAEAESENYGGFSTGNSLFPGGPNHIYNHGLNAGNLMSDESYRLNNTSGESLGGGQSLRSGSQSQPSGNQSYRSGSQTLTSGSNSQSISLGGHLSDASVNNRDNGRLNSVPIEEPLMPSGDASLPPIGDLPEGSRRVSFELGPQSAGQDAFALMGGGTAGDAEAGILDASVSIGGELLPSDEYGEINQRKANQGERPRSCLRVGLLAAAVVAALVTIVVIFLRRRAGNDEGGPSGGVFPTLNPTTPPSTAAFFARVQAIETIVLDVSNPFALQAEDSPQRFAFDWVVDDNLSQIAGEVPTADERERIITRYALATFYFSTVGETWLSKTNWLNATLDECQWQFLTCTGRRITKIDTQTEKPNGNLVAGTIPSEISVLSSLDEISLPKNQIVSLDRDIELRRVRILNLFGNRIVGKIPGFIYRMTTLESMDLASNRLTGVIEQDISNLQSLLSLTLRDNELSGALISELDSMSNLQLLDLGGRNQFSGIFRTAFKGLVDIRALILDSNGFIQGLDDELIAKFTKLTHLSLSDNRSFGGTLPTVLGSLSQLKILGMEDSGLTGTIPSELASAPLETLLLAYNFQLVGAVPDELCQVESLTTITINSRNGCNCGDKCVSV